MMPRVPWNTLLLVAAVSCGEGPDNPMSELARERTLATRAETPGLQKAAITPAPRRPALAPGAELTQTVECGAPYADPGAVAQDQCAGDLTRAIVRTGSVNALVPGTYTLRYNVKDPSGNAAAEGRRIVVVSDSLKPSLTVRGPLSLQLACGAQYTDPGATASDQCDGDMAQKITVTSDLDLSRAGQYTVSYKVTDRAGNVASADRLIKISGLEAYLSDYTLFLLTNFSGGGTVRGKVAAGANISLADFSVGAGLPNTNVSQTLVAGANLSLARGTVWGQAFYGGDYSADSTVTYQRGAVARGTPIDFNARFTGLRSLTSKLAALAPTGTVTLGTGAVLTLRGANPKVNVFQLNATAFAGISRLAINAPAGSLVVVNVLGPAATLYNFSTLLSGGIDPHGVIYNFVDGASISVTSVSLQGTVLAPYAAVSYYFGTLEGSLYAVSLASNADAQLSTLSDHLPCP